jgi:pimeloyl-ACP methyl ester carboxylesterase
VAPFSLNEVVRPLIPPAEFHPIPDAGHVPHLERPEVVNPLLIDFFRRE